MQKLRSKIIVLLVIPLLFTQCHLLNKDKSEPITIQRFEQDFYSLDTTDFVLSVQDLAASYPDFWPVFVEGVLNIASDHRDVDSYLLMLYEFRSHPSMIGLYDSIQYHYPDLSTYEQGFQSAFKEYKKHYPKETTPEVVSFISEFGNKAILYDHGIGISLDMFLGPQYPFYGGIGIPNYMYQHFVGEQILPNAMRVLAEDHAWIPNDRGTMLDRIIYEGKKLYFAQKMLKHTPSHQIIELTAEQYDWCTQNEANIWAHFIETNILFSEKYTEYNRYIDPSPTTYGMPPEAPGRTGIWVGWQIVNAYMAKKSGVSLDKLMQEPDSRKILEDSGYRPRKD